MIDTHCHLAYAALAEQLPQVLARAREAGLRHIITIGTKWDDAQASLRLAGQHDGVTCAVGIHPHHAEETTEDELDQVINMFSDPAVLAAGEMGLDYHYDFSPRDLQRRVFDRQIAAAVIAEKPLILHSRESVDDCLAILESHGNPPGVFHCFTGSKSEARRILDAGYYLGFTGVITFKKSDLLREVVASTPADRLLLETDAPYLAPEPLRRQKINEPALIAHTYRLAAQIRNTPLDALIRQLASNAAQLFGPSVSQSL